jgi:subtilisin family serine protease
LEGRFELSTMRLLELALLLLVPRLVSAALVPFFNNPAYSRCEYDWWKANTGQSSDLYLNGVYQSSEYGTNDLRMEAAWLIQPNANGVKVGVIDMTGHMARIVDLITNTAPGAEVIQRAIVRYEPDFIAGEMIYCVNAGCQVIVLAWGTSQYYPQLSFACRYAAALGAVVVCALPNAARSIDEGVPDYPASWAGQIVALLPVTSTDRNGNLYGMAAWSTNAVAAPGRNIIAAGTYSSGTSYAASITAGIVALSIARHPDLTPIQRVELVRATAIPIENTRRIDPVGLLSVSSEHNDAPDDLK